MAGQPANFQVIGSPIQARLWSKSNSISPVSWPSILQTGSQQVIGQRQRSSLTFFFLGPSGSTAYICPAQDEFGRPLAASVMGAGCFPLSAGAGLTIANAASAFNACTDTPGSAFTVLEFLEGEVIGSVFTSGGSGSTPPATNLYNDGGVVGVLPAANWPSSQGALPAGSLWSNGGLATVIPGITPNPSAPPVFFAGLTATALLALGGGNLPLTNPGVGSGQLWNNGGVVSVG